MPGLGLRFLNGEVGQLPPHQIQQSRPAVDPGQGRNGSPPVDCPGEQPPDPAMSDSVRARGTQPPTRVLGEGSHELLTQWCKGQVESVPSPCRGLLPRAGGVCSHTQPWDRPLSPSLPSRESLLKQPRDEVEGVGAASGLSADTSLLLPTSQRPLSPALGGSVPFGSKSPDVGGSRILQSRNPAGASGLGPAAPAGGSVSLSWLSGHEVSQAACVIKPSIWLYPEGSWRRGAGPLPLPGSGTGAAGGPRELEFTGLVARLVTADLLLAPRLRMLQGLGGADWLVSFCSSSAQKLPGSDSREENTNSFH